MSDQVKYYRHFKGGKYKVLAIGQDSETLEKVVIYQALYGEMKVWVRPYEMFFGKTEKDGVDSSCFMGNNQDIFNALFQIESISLKID